MQRWLAFAILFVSTPAFASEWILCSVRYEESHENAAFKPFEGGSFIMDIQTGNAFLRATAADGTTVNRVLVDDQNATSYVAPRQTCEYNPSVSRDENGVPTSFFIVFGSCHLRKPDGTMYAVASASEFLDFKGNRGLYQESYYQGGMEAVQPWFRFNDCLRLTP